MQINLSTKVRIGLLFAASMLLAVGGFAAIFLKSANFYVSGGIALMCFVGFYVCFSAGYDLRAEMRGDA